MRHRSLRMPFMNLPEVRPNALGRGEIPLNPVLEIEEETLCS